MEDLNSTYKNLKNRVKNKTRVTTNRRQNDFFQMLGSNKKVHRFDRKHIFLNQFHSGMRCSEPN